MNRQLEHRAIRGLEHRAAKDGFIGTLSGYAAVWDSESQDFGGWREVLSRGCFKKSLQNRDDVFAFYQHDSDKVLARTKAGNLRLAEDDKGLRIEMDLIDTQLNRDVLAQVRSGNVDSMSFGMPADTIKARWESRGDYALRTIESADLVEVSIVTFPAYTATEVSARSFETFRKETSSVPLDLLRVCVEVEKLR